MVFDKAKVFVRLHDLILEIAIPKASEKGEVKGIFLKLVDNYVAENTGKKPRNESKK